MRVWTDMLGSQESPYDFVLDAKSGEKFQPRPPYPNVEIISNEHVEVERFVQQVIRIKATLPEEDAEQDLIVTRFIAVLEGGGEVELDRMALPAEMIEKQVDITRCVACGEGIVHGETVLMEVDGVRGAYHKRCVSD